MDFFPTLATWIMMIFLQTVPVADYHYIGSDIYIQNEPLTVSFEALEPPAEDYWSMETVTKVPDRSITLTAGGFFDGENHRVFSITDQEGNSYFSINDGDDLYFPEELDMREVLYLDEYHILEAVKIESESKLGATVYNHHYSDGEVEIKFEIWDYGMSFNIQNILIQAELYGLDLVMKSYNP